MKSPVTEYIKHTHTHTHTHTYIYRLKKKITAEEGTIPNSFHEATLTLITKSDKDNTKKKTIGQNH